MIVIHLWSDIADPDSFLAIEALTGLGDGIEVEHHAFTAHEPASEAALAEYKNRGLTVNTCDTTDAHALIYAAKATGANPVEAARAGMTMARTLGLAATTGQDISSREVLDQIATEAHIETWDLPEYYRAVEIDREDGARVHITTLPYVIIGGLIAASGLKSREEYRELVGEAARALGISEAAAREELRRASSSDPSH